MIRKESSVPAPPTEERLCACYEGVVYIGHMNEDPETGDEVEVVVGVPCRRCADSR